MIKKSINCILVCGLSLVLSVFFSTCGLEEYYYLPQVPPTYINTELNTSATIILPPLTEYYARNYKIYYRIYISDQFEAGTINTSSLRSAISSNLESDFNFIYPSTDPTSTTTGIPANTLFNSRNYFELALEGLDINSLLTTSGGIVRISFPTASGGYPVLSINNGPEYYLSRSNMLISPEPKGDKSFRNTTELNAPENAIANINADVSSRSGLSQRYAYVSMYVVAVGINQSTFTPLYSKPTHINIFKLPD